MMMRTTGAIGLGQFVNSSGPTIHDSHQASQKLAHAKVNIRVTMITG